MDRKVDFIDDTCRSFWQIYPTTTPLVSISLWLLIDGYYLEENRFWHYSGLFIDVWFLKYFKGVGRKWQKEINTISFCYNSHDRNCMQRSWPTDASNLPYPKLPLFHPLKPHDFYITIFTQSLLSWEIEALQLFWFKEQFFFWRCLSVFYFQVNSNNLNLTNLNSVLLKLDMND